ncbi:hypothetical protein ACA910_006702 [Epithemia clementina (nom. ined.)]
MPTVRRVGSFVLTLAWILGSATATRAQNRKHGDGGFVRGAIPFSDQQDRVHSMHEKEREQQETQEDHNFVPMFLHEKDMKDMMLEGSTKGFLGEIGAWRIWKGSDEEGTEEA